MVEVQGFCDERFRSIGDAFRESLDTGVDKGASIAVTVHGESVVDLWGGARDYELRVPWEHDTIVRVFSSSKVMTVIVVLMLVDRGLLDLDEPIATYWPGFAQHGKGAITTRQVLLHTTGLPGFGRAVTFDELSDPDRVRQIIEDAELWHQPGTLTCYHAQTFGAILGEVVARVAGVEFEEFFQREIAGPLDADFHFGLPPEQATRVATIWPADDEYAMDTPMGAAVNAELVTGREWIDPDRLATVMAGASGITNARAMARIGTIISLRGEVEGRRYLSADIVADAGREHAHADDLALGWCRRGLGFGIHSEDFPAPTPTTMHWGGYGGSFLTMDPVNEVTFAFAQNQLITEGGPRGDERRLVYWRLLGEILA